MRCTVLVSLESVQLHAQSQINCKSNTPKFTKDEILIRLLAIFLDSRLITHVLFSTNLFDAEKIVWILAN